VPNFVIFIIIIIKDYLVLGFIIFPYGLTYFQKEGGRGKTTVKQGKIFNFKWPRHRFKTEITWHAL